MAVPNSQKNNHLDLVKRNEVLSSLVVLEDKARRDWHRKWSFLLDLDKVVLEEAAGHGVSEEEYRRWTVKRKTKAGDMFFDLKMTGKVPETSSAMVGWRSAPDHSLERLGPLYVSPVRTLPPEEAVSSILLG